MNSQQLAEYISGWLKAEAESKCDYHSDEYGLDEVCFDGYFSALALAEDILHKLSQ